MKKLILALLLSMIPVTASAAVTFPINGGTGSSTLSGILMGNGTSPINTLKIGSGLNLTGTTLSATGGSGGSSFGQSWEINGLGQLTPTTTLDVFFPQNIINTGYISNSLGFVGAPSYTFTGDLTTGIWQSAASNIDFSIAGTNALNISSIGLTIPNNTFYKGYTTGASPINLVGINSGDVVVLGSVTQGLTIDGFGTIDIHDSQNGSHLTFGPTSDFILNTVNVSIQSSGNNLNINTPNGSGGILTLNAFGGVTIENTGGTPALRINSMADGCAVFSSTNLISSGVPCYSTSFNSWYVDGSPTYLEPTTTIGIIVSASSTISNLSVNYGTTTNSTSTNQYISGSLWLNNSSFTSLTGTGLTNTAGVLTNSAPDQTVVLNNGTNISVTGTYPTFTINSTGGGSSAPNVIQEAYSGTKYYEASTSATTNLSWKFENGFIASASSTLASITMTNATVTNATTTNLNFSGITSRLLGVDTTGNVVGSTSIGVNLLSGGLNGQVVVRKANATTWTSATTTATSSNSGGWGYSDTNAVETLNIPTQDGTQAVGLLNKTDWTTFNGKQAAGAYLTSVTADAPLSGAGTSGSHLVFTNPGYITANQTITLSGDCSGSGTTGITTNCYSGLNNFASWSLQGSPLYLAPTTTRSVLINSSTSTITNLLVVNGTTTNATSTNLVVTGNTTINSFSGILKGTSGLVSTASNGTDYSLITANTCGTGHFSSVTAAGVFTCTADSGGGGASTDKWATSTDNVNIQPNVGQGIMVTASSTIQKLTVVYGTTTNSTSTTAYFSNNVMIGGITSGETLDVNGTFAVENPLGTDIMIVDSKGITNMINASSTYATSTNATSTNLAIIGTAKNCVGAAQALKTDVNGLINCSAVTASANPGGIDTQFQYNDGGGMGGANGVVYQKTTGKVMFGGGQTADDTWQYAFNIATTSYPQFEIGSTSQDIMMITATTTAYDGSYNQYTGARISVGTSTANIPQDQFFVDGRINTGDWNFYQCTSGGAFGNRTPATAMITDANSTVLSVTTGTQCGDFAFDETPNGQMNAVVEQGSGYLRIQPGATGAGGATVANDGAGLRFNSNFVNTATNTPVMEVRGRIDTAQNASSSLFMIGFGNITQAGAGTLDFATVPTRFCGFIASTTKANWQAVCTNGSNATTTVDTGVASSTVFTGTATSMYDFRLEVSSTTARFFIRNGPTSPTASSSQPVATITTNIPNTTTVTPMVGTGSFKARAAANFASPFQVNRIRLWLKEALW